MSAGTYPQVSLTAYGGEFSTTRYMKVMIGLSLVLHLVLLLLIAGLRLPSKMERPLAAYQVSLVTSPTPSVDPKPVPRPVEPEHPKAPQSPVAPPAQPVLKQTAPPPQPVRLAPTPHVRVPEPVPAKPAPVPPAPKVRQEPPPAPAPQSAVRQSEAKPVPAPVPPPPRPVLNRDILRGIALPPRSAQIGPGRSHPRWNAERDPLSDSNRCSKDVEQLNRAGIDVRCDSTNSASARACDSATFIDE